MFSTRSATRTVHGSRAPHTRKTKTITSRTIVIAGRCAELTSLCSLEKTAETERLFVVSIYLDDNCLSPQSRWWRMCAAHISSHKTTQSHANRHHIYYVSPRPTNVHLSTHIRSTYPRARRSALCQSKEMLAKTAASSNATRESSLLSSQLSSDTVLTRTHVHSHLHPQTQTHRHAQKYGSPTKRIYYNARAQTAKHRHSTVNGLRWSGVDKVHISCIYLESFFGAKHTWLPHRVVGNLEINSQLVVSYCLFRCKSLVCVFESSARALVTS